MDNEMNPPHLRNLLKNPGYYEPDMEDIKLGDDIVIGEYASNRYGEPPSNGRKWWWRNCRYGRRSLQ